MVEPIGSLMVSQYQSYKPNSFSNTQEAVNMENISSMVETQTINKMHTVSNLSESAFNKNNENNNFNNQTKKEFLEKDKKKIKENVDKINKQIKNTSVRFSVHEKSNRIEIKVIDKNTDKVIREIPPEKMLDAYADRMELLGLGFDVKK